MASTTQFQVTKSDGEDDGNAEGCNAGSIRTKAEIKSKLNQKISNLKDMRKHGNSNNITIVRSNNVLQALDLPSIINLNP